MHKSHRHTGDSATPYSGADIGKSDQDAAAVADGPPKRTAGLKLFDTALYPILTNFGVFAISVAATYLTTKGGDKDAAGKLVYGKVGEWFHNRGNWMTQKFKGFGMSHSQADMSKMVFFSFADGCAMAPLVKLLEDRRECIAERIDTKLGTQPVDRSVYEAEPKQGWGSVLGGRLATCLIVIPTAVALDKSGLNHTLFIKPGMQMGEYIKQTPKVAKMFGKLDIGELSKIGLFEFFYTSVCTAGLYVNSRCLARWFGKKEPAAAPVEPVAPVVQSFEAPKDEAVPAVARKMERTKRLRVDAAHAGFGERVNTGREAGFSISH